MTKPRKHYLSALIVAYAALGLVYTTLGYETTWKIWKIPFGYPPFMDARVITAGAVAYREGLDPMLNNPADIAQRKLNYPRVWHALYRAGVNEHHGLGFGLVFLGAFVVGTAIFVKEPGWMATGVLLAGIFSPAVMLGVERGNTDLIMFFLLAAAIVLAERGTWLALALVLAAFVLKLFPLAALAAMLSRPRDEALKAIAIGAALAVLYLLYSYNDLLAIRAGTPEGAWIAYGKDVIGLRLEFFRHPWGAEARWVASGLVLAAIVGSAWTGLMRSGSRLEASVSRKLTAFRAGAACYLGTFVLGSNFDYRLVFLLLAIPQLTDWSKKRGQGARCSQVALGAMLLAMWGVAIEQATSGAPQLEWAGFFLVEAATWLLFGVLAHLFAVSLPKWTMVWGLRNVASKFAARRDVLVSTR